MKVILTTVNHRADYLVSTETQYVAGVVTIDNDHPTWLTLTKKSGRRKQFRRSEVIRMHIEKI